MPDLVVYVWVHAPPGIRPVPAQRRGEHEDQDMRRARRGVARRNRNGGSRRTKRTGGRSGLAIIRGRASRRSSTAVRVVRRSRCRMSSGTRSSRRSGRSWLRVHRRSVSRVRMRSRVVAVAAVGRRVTGGTVNVHFHVITSSTDVGSVSTQMINDQINVLNNAYAAVGLDLSAGEHRHDRQQQLGLR